MTERRDRFLTVQLQRIRLSLNGHPVLRGIDWRIEPGQRWLLRGPNGAGKTVLLKLVAGELWPDPGTGQRQYFYRGERYESPYGIQPEIAYLGAERQDRYERYGWNFRVEDVLGTGIYRTDIPLEPLGATDRQRIVLMLGRLGMQALARRRFLTLSYGERRLVLLARALLAAPKLLLLDELFNGLDTASRERALRCLAALSRSRLPWVLSSHRSDEVPAATTHCVQLQAGRMRRPWRLSPRRAGPRRVLTRASPTTSSAPLPPRPAPEPRLDARSRQILVRVCGATVWREGHAALRDCCFELRRGQCWVVHGANGSGKSTLIQLLYGDVSVASGGSIERAGIGRGVPIERFKLRVGLIAPELQALHPRRVRVDESVAAGLSARIGYGGDGQARVRPVRRALRRVGAAGLAARELRTLSYGQLRRVLFARALVREPDILLLDEPYTGLDAATRKRLAAEVERQVKSGVTVVLAAHHVEDWLAGATHELQLSGGRTRYAGPLQSRPAPAPAVSARRK